MKYSFEDLIDIKQLQNFIDTLYNTFGLPSATIDLEGKILTGSGRRSNQ